jgi:RNA polymerase sigma factor (sigma-70 family)
MFESQNWNGVPREMCIDDTEELPASCCETGPAAARQTIAELYRQEAAPLRLFVSRIVRNRTEADDIVQETFLRVWRALARGQINSPRAVLFKAARNLALNHIRNDRLRSSDAVKTAYGDVFPQIVSTAEAEIIASEEAAACRQLLDGMPLRCREAFVLRVVDELSFKEMSEQMQLSVSTIEKHIGKGKQICRASLAQSRAKGEGVLDSLIAGIPDTRKLPAVRQPALAMAAG